MKKIVDICQHDHPINWDLARKELDLVIFRTSKGQDTLDKRYLRYASECKIPYGVYHYVKAGTAEEAKKEAKFFVECAHLAKQKPLFYIADIENEAQNETTTEPVCVAFLQTLRSLGCEKIGLYINRKYKYAGKAIDMCDIMWIPHWGPNNGNIPGDAAKPKYYNDLWQYTSQGTLAGIDETVDLNLLNGNKTLEYFTEGWTMPSEILGENILRPTFSGQDVKELQTILKSLIDSKVKVDGYFDEKTEKAVKKLQEQNGLKSTGIYDIETHEVLMKIYLKQSEEKTDYITVCSVNVRVGDNTSYEKIKILPKKTLVNLVYDKNNQPIISNNNWYAVYLEDKIGWIYADYIEKNI